MTTLLLCNVGNRDVQIDSELLPVELRDTRLQRQRIAYLQEQIDSLGSHIRLPLLDTTIQALAHNRPDQVVLFGSDQADLHHREGDTAPAAGLARELLVRRRMVEPTRIRVQTIGVNPASHNLMFDFFETLLPQLDAEFQPSGVLVQATGGTPAMSIALQLVATSVFEERVKTLYIEKDNQMPHEIALGRRLLGGPLRKVLQANLNGYQYEAAQATWRLFEPYFTDTAPHGVARVVEALLRHAAARINLDLTAARVPLMAASAAADGRYQLQISAFYNSIMPQTVAVGLAEVLHVAQTRLETHNYADFLTQLVRFVENGLRSVCLGLGVQFVSFQGQPDPHGAKVAQSWLDQHGITGKIPIGQAGLQQLLRKFASNDPQARAVLNLAHTLEPLIRLRNATTHSLVGVSQADLEQAAQRRASEVLELLDATFAELTGSPRPANPYHEINNLVAALLKEPR